MLSFVFAALVVLLDQFFKRWILLTLALYDEMELIPGVIGLTHFRNTGAAFSILADQKWLLIVIACVASLLLIAILLRYNEGFWGTLGLSAVLGGTIGNLVDRISYGEVVDIFEFQFVDFAIFNIADIFITLGGITFLLYFIATTIKPAKKSPLAAGASAAEQVQFERPQVEDQIGLYDFQYGEEHTDSETSGYESASYTEHAYGEYTESDDLYERGEYSESEYQSDYPEADSELPDVADMNAAIGALSSLEQELLEGGSLDDYDLDDMLREYGFENDSVE